MKAAAARSASPCFSHSPPAKEADSARRDASDASRPASPRRAVAVSAAAAGLPAASKTVTNNQSRSHSSAGDFAILAAAVRDASAATRSDNASWASALSRSPRNTTAGCVPAASNLANAPSGVARTSTAPRGSPSFARAAASRTAANPARGAAGNACRNCAKKSAATPCSPRSDAASPWANAFSSPASGRNADLGNVASNPVNSWTTRSHRPLSKSRRAASNAMRSALCADTGTKDAKNATAMMQHHAATTARSPQGRDPRRRLTGSWVARSFMRR